MDNPMTFTLELGKEKPTSFCECCENVVENVHGFVYKNMDAYAVYLASWTRGHGEEGVSLAVGLGEWGENATSEQRTSLGLEIRNSGEQYTFGILEPSSSPWGKTAFIGQMLTREQALRSGLKDDFFEVTEYIILNDARLLRDLEKLESYQLN